MGAICGLRVPKPPHRLMVATWNGMSVKQVCLGTQASVSFMPRAFPNTSRWELTVDAGQLLPRILDNCGLRVLGGRGLFM